MTNGEEGKLEASVIPEVWSGYCEKATLPFVNQMITLLKLIPDVGQQKAERFKYVGQHAPVELWINFPPCVDARSLKDATDRADQFIFDARVRALKLKESQAPSSQQSSTSGLVTGPVEDLTKDKIRLPVREPQSTVDRSKYEEWVLMQAKEKFDRRKNERSDDGGKRSSRSNKHKKRKGPKKNKSRKSSKKKRRSSWSSSEENSSSSDVSESDSDSDSDSEPEILGSTGFCNYSLGKKDKKLFRDGEFLPMAAFKPSSAQYATQKSSNKRGIVPASTTSIMAILNIICEQYIRMHPDLALRVSCSNYVSYMATIFGFLSPGGTHAADSIIRSFCMKNGLPLYPFPLEIWPQLHLVMSSNARLTAVPCSTCGFTDCKPKQCKYLPEVSERAGSSYERAQSSANRTTKTAVEVKVCFRFNKKAGNACTKGKKCEFDHVCEKCRGPHALSVCTE